MLVYVRFVYVLLFAVVLALAGACYQAIGFRSDIQRIPRPLHLVDAGGFNLNLHCTGHGSPTVVLEAGLADSLDTWTGIQPEIAAFARASELLNIEVSSEQARAADHIQDKPLIVLTAGRPEGSSEFQQIWINDLQPRLARLSTKGKRVIVPDSGHDMPADRPDAIVAAVRELLTQQ